MRIAWVLAVVTMACRRPAPEIHAEPSPSASASVSPSAVVAKLEHRCRNGLVIDADAGASDGWGDGIGLGTVGGFGGHASTPAYASSRVTTEGTAHDAIAPLTDEATNAAMCRAFGDINRCIGAITKGKLAIEGTLETKLVVDAAGTLTPTVEGGSLVDPALRACITSAMEKQRLAAGTGKYSFQVRTFKSYAVKMIETGTTISGKLAPEPVKRIVRANFPRFRACYEQGLRHDEKMHGVVAVTMTIDATGAVERADLDTVKSTLADAKVRSCIVGVYRTLSFLEPEGGKVTVLYPIDFSHDD
ncbi:MAG: AgmX/PglI C-terminal domain-containing protein [Polyangiales bacterium]